MRRPLRSRLVSCAWLAPLCVAACLLLVPASASAVSEAGCNARPNDTPKKLVECIKTDDLWQHMQALWQIAQENPGPTVTRRATRVSRATRRRSTTWPIS